ncbi:hypothetical protein [Streptomyces sp. NPDC059906]|uniref:hypothetical protein n=1 Tax=Streptomyces sp. NPDC059906 TaxID=3346997 RepID=UPI0036675842
MRSLGTPSSLAACTVSVPCRTELPTAITTILDAGRAVDDLRSDVTAEDIAAALIGIFTVAARPA